MPQWRSTTLRLKLHLDLFIIYDFSSFDGRTGQFLDGFLPWAVLESNGFKF